MASVQVGDPAPDVCLKTESGGELRLSDFRNDKVVVLFFYPKDNTAICTREACAFRDAYEQFVEAGAVVIGVSADSAASHGAFAARHSLPFYLASDEDHALRRAFGVPKTFGLLPGRVTYVIDKAGIVRLVFSAQLTAERHVRESLQIVRRLMGAT